MELLDSIMTKSIRVMIEKSANDKSLNKLVKKHSQKLHFIPIKYRIFGGILQSLNIKFGNFIEEAMTEIIDANPNNEVIEKYSGKKSNKFKITRATETLIDEYISKCETENYSEAELVDQYYKLINQIIINENNKELPTINFKHDVDVLFKDKVEEIYYYVEMKYNDDHDTGKFVDINRKLLKTYAYLVHELKISNKDQFKPILFYFTNKRMKGNIFIPEAEAIFRGKRFFESFTTIKYEDMEEYMLNISESPETIETFNNMYNKVVKDAEYKYVEGIDITCVKEEEEIYKY